MKTCATCAHWGKVSHDRTHGALCRCEHVVDRCVAVPVHDNNFLSYLFTSATFGCPLHLEKRDPSALAVETIDQTIEALTNRLKEKQPIFAMDAEWATTSATIKALRDARELLQLLPKKSP